jgi:hypothetical protein
MPIGFTYSQEISPPSLRALLFYFRWARWQLG